ncbi:MAG: DUF779 domain-containing protein [Alphaproteobacteria bacterium]|jgi:uncharacterized protein (DUF779 family)|nr:DUF779 domain-containing protein [Alphaproteobacteria bacterium]
MTASATAPSRVTATAAARAFIAEIRREHPDILFHQSGGCCDGSSPMCYPADDFAVGAGDVRLGSVDGVPVYIGGGQFERWRHTQLILDVVPGRGGMFSLDNGRERRFFTRSRVFDEDELARLAETEAVDPAAS